MNELTVPQWNKISIKATCSIQDTKKIMKNNDISLYGLDLVYFNLDLKGNLCRQLAYI